MSAPQQSIVAAITHAASAAARKLADAPIPHVARGPILGGLAARFGADMSQAAATDVSEYGSWQEFFTRPLRPDARPLESDRRALVSPADGVLHSLVSIADGQLFQIKGRNYSLASFVGDPDLARQFDGGTAITVYLRPKDYHRIHTPLDMTVQSSVHYPGTLWPVNPWANRNVPSLYCRNERVGCLCSTPFGPAMLWMVGALFVGGIRTNFPRGDDTGRLSPLPTETVLAKGSEFGRFEFGSTVILLLGAGLTVDARVRQSQEVHYGQTIAILD